MPEKGMNMCNLYAENPKKFWFCVQSKGDIL